MQVEDVKRWAYRTLYDPDPRPARVEVGTGLLDALKASVPPREDDEEDEDASPVLPAAHHTLLGLPLAANRELPLMGWRTLDWRDRELDSGAGV